MKPNEEIMEFLKENPTFYLATVDGYLPRVRPIGFAMCTTATSALHWASTRRPTSSCLTTQIWRSAPPTTAASGCAYRAQPTLTTRPRLRPPRFRSCPSLADLYNEETGNKLGIVYLDHLSAKLFSMSGTVKDIMSY